TLVAVVAQLRPGHVERRSALPLRHGLHLVGGHVQELGPRVHEAPDQPGTRHPVYLRPRTGHPFHDRSPLSPAARPSTGRAPVLTVGPTLAGRRFTPAVSPQPPP